MPRHQLSYCNLADIFVGTCIPSMRNQPWSVASTPKSRCKRWEEIGQETIEITYFAVAARYLL